MEPTQLLLLQDVDVILCAPETQDEGVWKYEHLRQFCMELNGLAVKLQVPTGWPDKHGRIFLVPFKSDLSSVRYSTRIHRTRHFLQGTRKTRLCLSGHTVVHTFNCKFSEPGPGVLWSLEQCEGRWGPRRGVKEKSWVLITHPVIFVSFNRRSRSDLIKKYIF